MEQAFPEIVHPFSKKEAQFFENCSYSVKFHNTSKSTIVYVGILGIQEKSELLLIVTAKLLQRHGLSDQISWSAQFNFHHDLLELLFLMMLS